MEHTKHQSAKILSEVKNQRKTTHAFTLVELVVVITILAILGTIGFLSVGGYSSKARDSARVADVSQLSKTLDLSVVTVGNYPVPDNYFTVTYSGGNLWYQGTAGNGVIQKLHTSVAGGGMDAKPTDPLKGTDYSYSVLAENNAYQIKAEYENDLGQTAMDALPTAYAAPGAPTIAYVRGNYGGLVAKTTTGSVIYLVATPSILTNSGITAGTSVELKLNSLSGTLVFNGKNLTGASSYNPGVASALVFTGAALPKDDSTGQMAAIATALKAAYTGTDVASNSAISTLLNTATGSLGTLGTSILTGQLGVSSGGGGGNGGGTTVACTGLPVGSLFYGSATSYNVPSGTSVTATYNATPTINTCQFKCNATTGYAWNGTVCALRNSLASDTTGWSSSPTGVGGSSCPTCIYNAYVKNLGQMTLLQCEIEAAKNHASMFYPDYYQNPAHTTSTGYGSYSFWRWRIHGSYGATSIQHSTHTESTASSTTFYCGLIKQTTANTASNDGGGTYTASAITETAPWATGTANGYTYNIYRYSTTNNYNCSLFLRVNGLNVYGKGTQSMLSGLATQTMTNGSNSLCSHGNCGSTYGYLDTTGQSDINGDSTSAVSDGYCYGYTIYK